MTSVLYDVPGPKARLYSLIGSAAGILIILGVLALPLQPWPSKESSTPTVGRSSTVPWRRMFGT